jgi:TRAP-type C4-dicarboxylate transport system substrate-binding protein
MVRKTMLGISILFLATMFSLAISLPAQGKTIVLTFASGLPSTSSTGIVVTKWMDAIEERTNGRVKFHRIWGGTLLKLKDMYEGIAGGVADLGMGVFGYNPGRFPLWEGMALPISFSSAVSANKVQWEVYKEFKPKELAGSKVLALFSCSPASIASKVPIRTMEDMKGLEIRATGYAAKIVKALGGTPVGAPMPAVYDMLAKGIVDATWSSLDTVMSYKHTDVTKYIIVNGLYVSSFYLVMNWDSWNALPPDIQKTIDSYSEDFLQIAGEVWDARHTKALQFAKERGLEIIILPPTELARWREATMPLRSEYVARMKAKGLPGDEFLSEILRLNEKYSK